MSNSGNVTTGLGQFVPQTDVFDVAALYEENINSQTWKEYLVRLRQVVNNIAIVLNAKDTALYDLEEFVPGQQWFPKSSLNSASNSGVAQNYRQVFRLVVNFGALPNTTTKSVAHGIGNFSAEFSLTRLYGAASDTTGLSYIPLPYSSATSAANNVELYMDNTNVYISTGVDYSSYNVSYIIIELLKS